MPELGPAMQKISLLTSRLIWWCSVFKKKEIKKDVGKSVYMSAVIWFLIQMQDTSLKYWKINRKYGVDLLKKQDLKEHSVVLGNTF